MKFESLYCCPGGVRPIGKCSIKLNKGGLVDLTPIDNAAKPW